MNLKSFLENKKKSVLFVGIGNVLLTDDGAGVYISHRIKEIGKRRVLTVEVSIENYIGKINDFQAEVIVLIDSVNFNRHAGFYDLIKVDALIYFTTNTHNISLKNISKLFNSEVWILGIQPESVKFGETLTKQVEQSANEIIDLINSL